MNLNSFRLKIALFSGLLSALLLVGSGVILWRFSYQFNLDRLDREIRSLGHPNLDRVLGGDHWVRLESALKFVSGSQSSSNYILYVKNYDRMVYQSPGWPGGISPDSFPVPVEYESANAVFPGQPPPPPPRRGEEISPRNPALPRKVAQFYTRQVDGRVWRFGVMGNPYVTLILGADIGEFNAEMAKLRNAYLALMPVVLLLVAGGAWLVARRAIRPVDVLAQTAERVTARGLDQRIPAMTRDREFNRLITVFNEMMDRLEKSFSQATRFSADASHELKTPLARLQMELEQALENAPSGSAQQKVYSSLLEEIHHLKAIVQKLLLLSLADAGRLELKCEPIDLSRMLENVVEDSQAQAPELIIKEDLAPNVCVNADPDLLEQALQNIAGNAIKYNFKHGQVRFELRQESGGALVRISNTGPGIAPRERDRIFDRFYRGDQSRSGRVPGVGLGLSISREILRAHGGEITCESPEDGLTTFCLQLPASQG